MKNMLMKLVQPHNGNLVYGIDISFQNKIITCFSPIKWIIFVISSCRMVSAEIVQSKDKFFFSMEYSK